MADPKYLLGPIDPALFRDPNPTKVTAGLEMLYERAGKLAVAELEELSKMVGIRLTPLNGDKYCNKEEYIYTLEEADDLGKVYRYFEEHGV